jgi:hypothetical protein
MFKNPNMWMVFIRDERENKVPTIYETGFDDSAGSSQRSAQPSMAERSRSHTTWYSNLLLLPNKTGESYISADFFQQHQMVFARQ